MADVSAEVEPRFKVEKREKRERVFGSTLPKPLKRINRVSRPKAEQLKRRVGLKERLIERSGGRCEMPLSDNGQPHHHEHCDGQGHDPAHIIPASLLDGLSDPRNHDPVYHLWLNRHCHTWFDTDPEQWQRIDRTPERNR